MKKITAIFLLVNCIFWGGVLFPINASAGYWLTNVAATASPRLLSAVAVVDNKLYVFGGYQDGKAVGSVEQYDPARNAWVARGSMPTPRYLAGAAAVNGKIYVIGGSAGAGQTVAAVEAYDPASDTWSSRAPLPLARGGVAVVSVNGKVVVIGGSDGSAAVPRVDIYDPVTDSWATAAAMSTPRVFFAAAVSGGAIYAIGGSQAGKPLASVEVYDFVSNSWSSKASLSVARAGLAAVSSDDGKIWAIAGQGSSLVLSSVETYDPQANSWSREGGALNTARRYLSAAQLNGRLYAIGGDTGAMNGLTSVEALDVTPVGGKAFDVTATASGGDGSLRLDALLTASSSHVGLNGEIYVAASFNRLWFFNNGKEWQGQMAPYFAGKLEPSLAIPVLNGVDVSGYPGMDIYVGYGLGSADMLTNNRYQRVYGVGWAGFKISPALQKGGHSYHNVALKSDGTVWTWGRNDSSQLGISGANATSSVPLQVAGLSGITVISAGRYHSLALRKDGTVWGWGSGFNGQLGSTTQSESASPLQVFGLTEVIDIASGNENNLALKSDGTVWAWGSGSKVPAQVTGLVGVVSIAAGHSSGFALLRDGTVRAWGWNNYGQLGNGTQTQATIPIPISDLSGVRQLVSAWDHSVALKTDGTVWTWGANQFGQLGNGTLKDSYKPVQVAGLNDVVSIATGTGHVLALKADGSIWAWGSNIAGELGVETNERCYYVTWVDYMTPTSGSCSSRPVQVVTLSNISAVGAGVSHSQALKSDGTVWAWGDNKYGQLGDGSTVGRIAPVQVSGPAGKNFLNL